MKTVAGTSFLQATSKVLVQLEGDRFFERDASTLHPGEMVLWEKEFMQADFEYGLLEASERYRRARDEVHENHPDYPGIRVPKLRAGLLRGLQEQGILAVPDLESRIFASSEGYADFDRPTYRAMEDFVHGFLQEHGKTDAERLSTSAIKKWLSGDVLAPRAWGVFDVLGALNPAFTEIYGSFDQDHGFHFSYLVYVILRRSVAAYFAKPRQLDDEEKEPDPEYTRRGHLTVKPEVEMILKQFFGETIDRKFQPVRVVSVKEVPPYQHDRPQEKPKIDPHLRRGVYTVKIDEKPTVTIKNLRTLFEDYRTIERVFLETMGVYIAERYGRPKTDEEEAVMHACGSEVTYQSLPPHETTDYFFRDITDIVCKKRFGIIPDKARVEARAREVLASIENGEIDKTLGFERLSTARFRQLLFRLNAQLPNGFRMWLMYHTKEIDAGSEERKKDAKQYGEMADRAYDRFVRSSGIPRNYQGLIDTMAAVEVTNARSQELARRVQERLELGIRQGIFTPYTREHLQSVLTEYGFPEFEQHAIVVDDKLNLHHPVLGVTQITVGRPDRN